MKRATLKYEDTTQSLRVKHTEIHSKLTANLGRQGVAILESGLDTNILQTLLAEVDPLRKQYNKVLSADKQIQVNNAAKLYGLSDLTSKDKRNLRFPGAASGMVNVYSSKLQLYVYDHPSIHSLATVLCGNNARIYPNRLRVQIPGKGGEENSHVDSNLGSDLDFTKPSFAVILSISNNRPFEYLKGSHTPLFISALKNNGYFKYNETKHFTQLHLEDISTADPLNLRDRWARCYLRAGDVIIFNTTMIHRVAPVTGKRCLWSMFISIECERKGYDDKDGKYAVPGLESTSKTPTKKSDSKRSYDNNRFVCPHQRGPETLRNSNLFSLLVNYQTYRWPSNKPTFYYMNQSIAHVKFKPEYMRSVEIEKYKTAPALLQRPVWPAGLGCDIPLEDIADGDLATMHIPKRALQYKKWVFDPAKLKQQTQILLGFKDRMRKKRKAMR